MQSLFAPKKKLSQHLQAGGQVFAARIFLFARIAADADWI